MIPATTHEMLSWALWGDHNASRGERLVLAAFAEHAAQNGVSAPTVNAVASMTKLARQSCSNAIGRLMRKKLLFRHAKVGRSTLYRLGCYTANGNCTLPCSIKVAA